MGERRRRIEVEWEDSQVSRDGWESVRSIVKRRTVTRCRSIGYVLGDDEAGVVLAGSLDDTHGNATGVITIPRSQIVKRRKLRDG